MDKRITLKFIKKRHTLILAVMLVLTFVIPKAHSQMLIGTFWKRRSYIAPTFVDIKDVAGVTTTTCTVVKPVGLAVGDLMITLIYDTSNLSTVTVPSGFSVLQAPYQVTAPYYSAKHYKFATAGDVAASNFTFTKATNFGNCGLMMAAFRGVDQATPYIKTHTTGNSATLTYTGSTSTAANSLLLIIGEGNYDITYPATLTTHGNTVPSHYTVWASKVLTSAGATGNYTSTHTSIGWTAALLILNPQ